MQVRVMSLAGLGAVQWVLKVPRVGVQGRVVRRPWGSVASLSAGRLLLLVQSFGFAGLRFSAVPTPALRLQAVGLQAFPG